MNRSDPADLLVDIRPYFARKLEAFRRWPEFCPGTRTRIL